MILKVFFNLGLELLVVFLLQSEDLLSFLLGVVNLLHRLVLLHLKHLHSVPQQQHVLLNLLPDPLRLVIA